MRIAVVYDYLPAHPGGAEKVLPEILQVFKGNVDLFLAGLVDSTFSRGFIDRIHEQDPDCKVFIGQQINYLKDLRLRFLHYRLPAILSGFSFEGYSHVICYTSFLGHSITVPIGTKKIVYFNTPSRVLWNLTHSHSPLKKIIPRFLLEILRSSLRRSDQMGIASADIIITISHAVLQRIKSFYNVDSIILYPPISQRELPSQSTSIIKNPNRKYFAHISRLESYKNIQLLIQTAPLLPDYDFFIIGEGPYQKQLVALSKKINSKNVLFTGFISDEQRDIFIRNAVATLSLNDEDFGLSKIESLQLGTQVVALARGAAPELLKNTPGGILFNENTPESLKEALIKATISLWTKKEIQDASSIFSYERFNKELQSYIV